MRFATLSHPWVRNMSKQDRWIIRLDDNGNPKSVVLVPSSEAKHLVTVAKDNFNEFPGFKGRSLPNRFASQLRGILQEGPLFRLLCATANITDSSGWWEVADQLIHTAEVEEKYKQIENFALDVTEGPSAIDPIMRAALSKALFDWEAERGGSEYVTDTAPRPNLPVIGLSYLISRNQDIPSFARYGLEGLASYPVHKRTVREMAACLEWITGEERRGRTWQSVPGKDKDSRDLLVVHVSGEPDIQARMADFFGEPDEPKEDREAFYAALAESVTRFFSGGQVHNATQNELLELLLLRKISPGVTRVETHWQPTIKQVKQVVSEWHEALNNVPHSALPANYMTPAQVTRSLRRRWIRDAQQLRYLEARWDLATLYDVMFSKSSAQPMVEAAYERSKTLLLVEGRSSDRTDRHRQDRADHLVTVGLALWYLGHPKEAILEDIGYKLGRFLQMADLLHRKYCEQERAGSMPPHLLGNAHFDAFSQSPVKAMTMIQRRLRLYQGFAHTRGDGLAKWALQQLGGLSAEIASALPAMMLPEQKAQMLLGYLARTTSVEANTGGSARSETSGAAVT